MDILFKPWPWYVAGPLIGITVPLLLLMGNKNLGVSSSLKQICAAALPGRTFSGFDWKKNVWNIFFVAGVLLGGVIAGQWLANPDPVAVAPETVAYLHGQGLNDPSGLMPSELFNWNTFLSLKGALITVLGGFLVGFGTTCARGCTSGHGIFGLSSLQWPSLIATVSFFAGGIIVSQFILPYILAL